jgi:hypothetical protein
MLETHLSMKAVLVRDLKNVNNEPDITAMAAKIQQETPHELRQ